MKILDLQDKETYENNELWQKMVDAKNRQWSEKKIDEANYHAQQAINYSCLFNAEECKRHAALVPEWAKAQEKTIALTAVARILVYEKKIEEALNYYEQTYALEPDHETAIEEAGWCCLEMKQWEKAVQWFTKGTLLEDEQEVFWEGLGLTLAQQQKYEEAIPAFKKALELCDVEYNGYYYDHFIGQCYANMNDFYRALGHYTKSLDANSTHAPALNDIAALYYNREGDMHTAIDYLKKAEAVAEQDQDGYALQAVYINLARLYDKMKEFELHQYYKAKILETLGFGGLFNFEDDEENEED